MSRFSVQLFWGVFLILSFVLGIGFWLTYHENQGFFDDKESRLLREVLDINIYELEQDIKQTNNRVDPLSELQERIDLFCRVFSTRSNLRITILDAQGKLLGDSDDKIWEAYRSKIIGPQERPEIAAALRGEIGEHIRESELLKRSYRFLAGPLQRDGQIYGVCRIAFSQEIRQADAWDLFKMILGHFLLMFVALISLLFFLSRIWAAPLKAITESSRKIAEGNLDEPILISGPLEMQQFAAAMDQMRKTVATQMATIRGQREDLSVTISKLKGSIIGLGRRHNIVLANPAAVELFHLPPDFKDQQLHALVRQEEILAVYEQARETRRDVTVMKDVVMFGRPFTLEIETFPLSTDENRLVAFILIVRNYTDMIRANRIRTDFVANASHEIRTPLATVRAATDNLLTIASPTEGRVDHAEDETLLHVMEVLDRNVRRLEQMAQDLLDLSDVQDETPAGPVETIDAGTIRQWAEDLFRSRATGKGVVLTVDVTGLRSPFSVDVRRIYLILQNLLENAIKFTPAGGEVRFETKDVDDACPKDERWIEIRCSDNGCGIPSEDLPRIFERFYRSRLPIADGRTYGTGLGLAIVKNAVEGLSGTVELSSREGEGTTVTVRLPLL